MCLCVHACAHAIVVHACHALHNCVSVQPQPIQAQAHLRTSMSIAPTCMHECMHRHNHMHMRSLARSLARAPTLRKFNAAPATQDAPGSDRFATDARSSLAAHSLLSERGGGLGKPNRQGHVPEQADLDSPQQRKLEANSQA